MQTLNAKVKDISFRIEDRGGLMITITLEGGGWGVCYMSGTFAYEDWDSETSKVKIKVSSQAEKLVFKTYELLQFFNVDNLKDIKGKYVRVELTDGCSGSVVRLIDILSDYKTFKWGD